jgi:hypothetical protein
MTLQVRAVAVAPGRERPYVETEWLDSIVTVTRGEIELECVSGARLVVTQGDVLWLAGLRLRALCNRGSDPAWLLAVSRRS